MPYTSSLAPPGVLSSARNVALRGTSFRLGGFRESVSDSGVSPSHRVTLGLVHKPIHKSGE